MPIQMIVVIVADQDGVDGGRLSMSTPGFVTVLMPNTLGPIESNRIGSVMMFRCGVWMSVIECHGAEALRALDRALFRNALASSSSSFSTPTRSDLLPQ